MIHDKFIFRNGQEINIETHPELMKSYLQKINSESKKICTCAYCGEEFGFPHLRLAHEKAGMNIVFESWQLHAGLVFSKSVLFLAEFHIVPKKFNIEISSI